MSPPFSRSTALLATLSCLCAALLLAFAAPPPLAAQPQGPAGAPSSVLAKPTAFLVPIEGEISFYTVALLARGLAEADRAGASRLILDIDSESGELPRMQEMVAMLGQLRDRPIDTVAFIRGKATSTAAFLALACKRIWVSPRAHFGKATPARAELLELIGGEDSRERYVAPLREEIRRVAAHHGASAQTIGAAMVDDTIEVRELRYRGVDGLIRVKVLDGPATQNLRATDGVDVLEEIPFKIQPLILDAQEALRVGLAEGRAASLSALANELGVDAKSIGRVEANWSEQLAGFLYSIRMFLLIAGVLLTVIALKAPGTGVPEALAILCFAFFFAGQWLVGLAEWTELLLFLGGIGLVLVEFFVLPGTLVAGVLGFLCVVAALFLSLQSFGFPSNPLQDEVMNYNMTSLLIAVVIVCGLALVFSRLIPKIPLFNKLMLDSNRDGESLSNAATGEQAASPLVGKRGTALTDLRPAGRVEIDGEPYDVVSGGAFLQARSDVQVVAVEGNRIVVSPLSQLEGGASPGDASPGEGGEAGMIAVHWLVFMLFVGLLLLVAEVFFVSFGILGTMAAVLTVSTVFFAFEHGRGVGWAFLIALVLLAPVAVLLALRILPRTSLGKRLILDGPTGKSTAQKSGLKDLIGRRGKVLTPLRPVGTILVDGQRFDAMTRGEGLEAEEHVEVLRVELGQLVVKSVPG